MQLLLGTGDSSAGGAVRLRLHDVWISDADGARGIAMSGTIAPGVDSLAQANQLMRSAWFATHDSVRLGLEIDAVHSGFAQAFAQARFTVVVHLVDSASGSAVAQLDSFALSQPWRSMLPPFVGRRMVRNSDCLAVVSERDSSDGVRTYRLKEIDFFPIDSSGQVADSAVARWASWICPRPYVRAGFSAIAATDFDGDQADELVLSVTGWLTPDSSGSSGQLWIYRGGEDFRLDSPSVMLRTGHEYPERPYVVRLDDDPFPDLALHGIGKYPMRVLWGTGRLPAPSDTLQLICAGVGPTGEKVTVRIDSDDVDDVVGSERINDSTIVYRFYLTASGKPPRTRPYGNADFDIEWRLRVPAWKRGNIGPLADTPSGREMIALTGRRASNAYFAFGGDGRGIDTRYDAWSPEPNFNIGGNLDANDDGWQDVLLGSRYSNYNNGVVVILAGGPYIPRDSLPAGAVRDVPRGHYHLSVLDSEGRIVVSAPVVLR